MEIDPSLLLGYQRTVLLIFPELWWGPGDLTDQCSVDFALHRLDAVPVPNQEDADRHAVRFICEAVDADDVGINDVLSGLCAAARALNDANLWCRSLDHCISSPLDRTLDFPEIKAALETFGCDAVLPR